MSLIRRRVIKKKIKQNNISGVTGTLLVRAKERPVTDSKTKILVSALVHARTRTANTWSEKKHVSISGYRLDIFTRAKNWNGSLLDSLSGFLYQAKETVLFTCNNECHFYIFIKHKRKHWSILFIYLFIYLLIYLFTYLFIYLFIYLFRSFCNLCFLSYICPLSIIQRVRVGVGVEGGGWQNDPIL